MNEKQKMDTVANKSINCELPDITPLPEEIRTLLERSKTVAVVGLSRYPEKDSYRVARYLIQNGYTIIPVNPNAGDIMGLHSHLSLTDIPVPVDIVCIFRPSHDVPFIVDEAIKKGIKAVWMQLGIVHNEAANIARSAGINVIMNKCMKIEHRKIFSEHNPTG